MNIIPSHDKENSLAIYRIPRITKGQRELYFQVLIKLSKSEPLTLQEARDIWIKNVCRSVNNDGKPQIISWYTVQDEKGNHVYRRLDMPEDLIKRRVTHWLISAIGALVIKGYLKVIPQIQLEDISL